jgi:hypothetical protein
VLVIDRWPSHPWITLVSCPRLASATFGAGLGSAVLLGLSDAAGALRRVGSETGDGHGAFILNSIDPDLPSGSFSHYRERPPIGWANVEWA